MYSLVSLFVTLIVWGVILWLVNTYLPIDQRIKTVINVLAVIIIIVWLLRFFQYATVL